MKHKGDIECKATLAAAWAAELHDLRTQTNEQQRNEKNII